MLSLRALRCLRLITSLPTLSVGFTVPAPITETTPVTSGSLWIVSMTAFCRLCISSNETAGPASVTALIAAVSCRGRKPFGATAYRISVAASVTNVTISVARWRCNTHSNVR